MPMNMSHCRFTNTLAALRECYDNMYDDMSLDEAVAQNSLLLLCALIAKEFECEIEDLRQAQAKRKRA